MAMAAIIERWFKLSARGSTLRTEVIAGVTTFFAMAYIILVNPTILAQTGMDPAALFAGTCLTCALGSLLMGLAANYPIAMGPSMGLNVYFVYAMVKDAGLSWPLALGAVFCAGLIFFSLVLFRVHRLILNATPVSLKIGLIAGIGLFLALIALHNMGVSLNDSSALLRMGSFHSPTVLISFLGFCLMVALDVRQWPGGIFLSIVTMSLLGMLLGINHYHGTFALPASVTPVLLKMEFSTDPTVLKIIFCLVFVILFGDTGSLLALSELAGLTDNTQQKKQLTRGLLADSSSVMLGASLGCSPTTCFIESGAGIRAGGRTGLTAFVVALLFLCALFFGPLAQSIPTFATAPALLFVSCMMISCFSQIEWDDFTESVPAAITTISMPFTFSIADGICLGFISYVLIKLLSGKFADLNPLLILLSLLFAGYLWYG